MIDPVSNMPIIILKNEGGDEVLPIWVGIFEANAIAMQMEEIVSPRPMTHDLLKNRVLPVWRQVMGRNGGWHEGGEYVAVGIGRAVYEVPAMWRKATGEDLFRSEPGIRGFLDFLVYRTRPDDTHFRWGDGAFFDRKVPDRIPLAIEYRHAAAYSLYACPRQMQPSAWPWGLKMPPLADRRSERSMPALRGMAPTSSATSASPKAVLASSVGTILTLEAGKPAIPAAFTTE